MSGCCGYLPRGWAARPRARRSGRQQQRLQPFGTGKVNHGDGAETRDAIGRTFDGATNGDGWSSLAVGRLSTARAATASVPSRWALGGNPSQ
ncbi:hypothetical protein AXG93_3856s1100 [Marchantia polymorpha subsp. ruderalis]|uniref:Uncharacterized protein n=1 Tax=Marchantia polymorpha subsp. ruderalis TaxID=1480154 RepID=A0A176VXB5_MARPO|nr:hypothetical protein AXG93_3856s1100 [Marchantia polymorpha subsp. ruderalis]